MELGRRMDEWRVISQKIPSVDLFPASTLLPGETPQGVNPREHRILGVATGYYTVSELAELLRKPVLSVAKDLYGLVMAGHVVLKGLRSGRPAPVEAPPAEPTRDLVPVSTILGSAAPPLPPPPPPPPAPVLPEYQESDTAIVRLQLPRPQPTQSFFEKEEPLPETVGGGIAGETPPVAPPVAALVAPPVAAPAPAPLKPVLDDSQRMVKLMNFTQRIAQASKMVLPEHHHEMVNRLQARATQQIISGDGPDAVKGLALAISRGAVDAGCDGDMVRTLNTHLKALFSTR
jgi:hypothetical protein